jgi:uncharacterized protein (DUF433 family)
MAKGRPLTRYHHAQILALHRQGMPVKAIAAAVSCSSRAVYQLLIDARINGGWVKQRRALVNMLQAGGDGLLPPQVVLPVETVVNRYLADESIKSIAGCYRVSQQRIRRLLVEAGVTIRARRHRVPVALRRWTAEEGARALRLRAEGRDMATIGLMLNRSTWAVRSWLKEHDRSTRADRMPSGVAEKEAPTF